MESGGVKTSHKHSRAKSSVSSFKIIRKSSSKSKSADFHRQFVSGCLSQQAGRYPLSGDVCTNLENHGLDECQGNPDSGKTYSRESQCVSRFLIKKGQGDSDQMSVESSSIQSDLPLLASTNGRFVYNKVESQAANVCVSCPRQSGLGNRCIEHLLGGSGRLCVLSSGSHSSGNSKDDHLQVQNHHDCTRVARDVLVLGSGGSVHKAPSETSHVGGSVDSAFQLTYLNLHAWHLESVMNIQKDSQRRWRSELRSLRDTPQGESMNQGGTFLGSGVKRIRWMSPISLFQM